MQKCLSKAFIPVMRSMWPGINGNAGLPTLMVSNMRKRAVQASRFMLQMMQAALYERETANEDGNGNRELPEVLNSSLEPPLECGEEGLAIRIAVEVKFLQTIRFRPKRLDLTLLKLPLLVMDIYLLGLYLDGVYVLL